MARDTLVNLGLCLQVRSNDKKAKYAGAWEMYVYCQQIVPRNLARKRSIRCR